MGREKEDDGRKYCSSTICPHPQNKSQKGNCLGYLSEDTLIDILTWLSAECLLSSARYTCKSWAAMIRSSDFAEKHLLRSKPGIFVQSTKRPYGAQFLEVKDNGEFGVTTLNPDFPGRFVNSCDGLILLYENARGVLYVTNPVTKRCVKVHPMLLSPKLMYPPCAIVRVPRTGEIKLFASLVLIESKVCYSHWHVRRLGKDCSWTKIAVEPGDFEFRCSPIYTGGNDLYWITEQRVIVMDVDKEAFRQFPLPQGPHRWHSQYLKMENRLASIIFVKEGFQMHIFDADSGKWTLHHEIKYLDYPTGGIEFLSEFFALWINQELIIKLILVPTLNTLFFSYDMKSGGRLKKIEAIQEGSFDVGLHTNSLVSWKNTLP